MKDSTDSYNAWKPVPDQEQGSEMMERLANIEHERWSGWMRWLYRNGTWGEDGSFTIKADKAMRWFILSITRYDELDEDTKEYDRIEVRKTLDAPSQPTSSQKEES